MCSTPRRCSAPPASPWPSGTWRPTSIRRRCWPSPDGTWRRSMSAPADCPRHTRRRFPMNGKKWLGLAVIFLFSGALVVAGYLRWKHSEIFPSTEDAYVAGDIVPVASRIPGTLLTLTPEENQLVHQGEVVATLDPRDMDAAVARAEAAVATARSVLAADRARIAQAQA
ncbi:MAG TPA: biotin/lipoyl-binding protein, partial [Acidobacteria bacterium]|nr:biotin/lipoyl-binding protein [Acidobacteriota bacterium]